MLQHALRTAAAEVLAPVLPYTSYQVDQTEYLGTVDASVEETVDQLRDKGYHYQVLSARKTHPNLDKQDSGSFARIPREGPPEAAETRLESVGPRQCQYHVQLFEVAKSGTESVVTELYGHYEIHPYPHVPDWDSSRPSRHYRPTWDRPSNPRSEWTYLRGVRDSRLDDLVEVVQTFN